MYILLMNCLTTFFPGEESSQKCRKMVLDYGALLQKRERRLSVNAVYQLKH